MTRHLVSSGTTMANASQLAAWEARMARKSRSPDAVRPATVDTFPVRILHGRLGRRPLVYATTATNAEVTTLLLWAVAHRLTIDIQRLDTL